MTAKLALSECDAIGPRAVLGESPVWDPVRACLWWIDIEACQLHRFDPDAGTCTSHLLPGRPGLVALHSSGDLVLGIEDTIGRYDPGFQSFKPRVAIGSAAGIRINDGSSDRSGRLWFGTMDDGLTHGKGSLFRLDAAGPIPVGDGLVASNGPAISGDGRTLFHCDSMSRRIFQYSLDAEGQHGNPSVFRHFTPEEGLPDGMACDVEGGLWVALWGSGSVIRLDHLARTTASVDLPIMQVTACTFAGPDLGELYITTASLGLNEMELTTSPSAGCLYRCKPGFFGFSATPVSHLSSTDFPKGSA